MCPYIIVSGVLHWQIVNWAILSGQGRYCDFVHVDAPNLDRAEGQHVSSLQSVVLSERDQCFLEVEQTTV